MSGGGSTPGGAGQINKPPCWDSKGAAYAGNVGVRNSKQINARDTPLDNVAQNVFVILILGLLQTFIIDSGLVPVVEIKYTEKYVFWLPFLPS